MADENKTPQNDDSVREEMEELARIFREELGKAKEEAENAENKAETVTDIEALESSYEVEGYAVTTGEKSNTEPEEMCECCGERPRGTERDPKSPFCEDCAAIMEKYPYDKKGIVAFICTLAVMLVSIGVFIEITPVFVNLFRGNEALSEKRLYSALSYYSLAETAIAEKNDNGKNFNAKNLRNSEIFLFNEFGFDQLVESKFNNAPMLNAIALIEDNYDVNHITNKKIAEIYNKLSGARATVLMLGKYDSELEGKYDEIINKFESLVGKKIYVTDLKNISDNNLHDELDENYTPTGKEKVFTYDEGWIRFYQYLYAEMDGKKDDLLMYLEKADSISEDYEVYIGSYLVQRYLDNQEYAKAEQIVKKIGKKNVESPIYYDLLARIYRYRDKNYNAAIEVCESGLKAAGSAYKNDDLTTFAGTYLYLEKALNLIMLKDYEGAYAAIDRGCSAQNDFYGYAFNEARDMFAVLALAVGDKDGYDKLAQEVAQNVEYYGEEYDFSSDVYDYKNNKVSIEDLALSGKYDGRFTD